MTRIVLSLLGVISLSLCVIGGCALGKQQEEISKQSIEQIVIREGNQDYSKIIVDNPDEYFKYSYYEPIEYTEKIVEENSLTKDIMAKAAILIDVDSSEIIFEKQSEELMAPASTTKLATAITAVNYFRLDEKITVGDEITMIGQGSSTAGLSQGEVLTFEELLQGLLLSSGNDAAYVIARATGERIYKDNIAYEGISFTKEQYVKRFVEEMNKNIKDMGLCNTRFMSPDGYDAQGQYTSASDLSKIAVVALENEHIKDICAMTKVTTKNGKHTWVTTNELMHTDSSYYYEYAVGMKTGSTDAAGKCLVSAADKDGRRYICVVLNSTTEGRYEDSLMLLNLL